MAHWNYRLWKITGENEDWLELRETHYNKKGEVCGVDNRAVDMTFFNKSSHSIRLKLSLIASDYEKCKHDVLDYETFKFAEWDK